LLQSNSEEIEQISFVQQPEAGKIDAPCHVIQQQQSSIHIGQQCKEKEHKVDAHGDQQQLHT
jgi:hypothetical protein